MEYAVSLDGKLPLAPPTKRIATHKEPDADALVATWLAERFLFSGTTSRVEFVAWKYSVPAKCPFDAVLDVGRLHDTEFPLDCGGFACSRRRKRSP